MTIWVHFNLCIKFVKEQDTDCWSPVDLTHAQECAHKKKKKKALHPNEYFVRSSLRHDVYLCTNVIHVEITNVSYIEPVIQNISSPLRVLRLYEREEKGNLAVSDSESRSQ